MKIYLFIDSTLPLLLIILDFPLPITFTLSKVNAIKSWLSGKVQAYKKDAKGWK